MTKVTESIDRTYSKQLGWVNKNRIPAGLSAGKFSGHVFPYYTKGGIALMVPDSWADDPEVTAHFEPLPKGLNAITIDGDIVTVA